MYFGAFGVICNKAEPAEKFVEKLLNFLVQIKTLESKFHDAHFSSGNCSETLCCCCFYCRTL